MSRSYDSRRRTESMRAYRPTETPATDVCTVYRQQWRRSDGGSARTFDVLALDEDHARRLGELRLSDKYRANVDDWLLDGQTAIERHTGIIVSILTIETAAERDDREQVYLERHDTGGADPAEAPL